MVLYVAFKNERGGGGGGEVPPPPPKNTPLVGTSVKLCVVDEYILSLFPFILA